MAFGHPSRGSNPLLTDYSDRHGLSVYSRKFKWSHNITDLIAQVFITTLEILAAHFYNSFRVRVE